jgi:formate hydrogenlyase subunit 6/NADH:ubiquinone oxidoreductase subunit I
VRVREDDDMPKRKSSKAGHEGMAKEIDHLDLVTIYIMGKKHEVPRALTILNALEYSGYRLIRGCGCREGFCGACATVYRTSGDYRLKNALACQTMVEDGMYLSMIPFYPANKALYDIDDLQPTAEQVIALYPEIFRCVSCNSCTKICPQDIDVMDYVNCALRGDIEKAADISFDCIMCGLCASRCPGELVQYYIGLLSRRLYSRHLAPPAEHLARRVEEIEQGKFDRELDRLAKADVKRLKKMYKERDIEE